MKALLLLPLVLFSSLSHARSIQGEKAYTLSHVTIDGQASRYVGLVNVNFRAREIKVRLYNDPCHSLTAEPGTIHCMAAAMIVSEHKVPLLTRERDGCRSAHFDGMIDQTPVDGVRTEIKITDNTTRICEDVVRSLVVVKMSVYNPWTNTTQVTELTK